MILYYIRHGDPIYNPDSLTPLGSRQAEAVSKRLSLYGLDEIYCSTSNRAILTAQPACELLKIQPQLLDFANEKYAWRELTVDKEDGSGKTWIFQSPKHISLSCEREVRDLGDRWFDHPEFAKYDFEKGIERVYSETDRFLADLGYAHMRYTGKYTVTKKNDRRVALFAHQGFGLAFLSCLLDIPYPTFCTHFDMGHTGMTVIEFADLGGYSVPKILTYSSDSHLYREGLPTKYNNYLYF
ncbi:MAG: histidine phosphatase family protein [Clostridia bacterium]|nr:histidine phosphatase family protein [Clostridia bacterium]